MAFIVSCWGKCYWNNWGIEYFTLSKFIRKLLLKACFVCGSRFSYWCMSDLGFWDPYVHPREWWGYWVPGPPVYRDPPRYAVYEAVFALLNLFYFVDALVLCEDGVVNCFNCSATIFFGYNSSITSKRLISLALWPGNTFNYEINSVLWDSFNKASL